jgi:hypothetical protein
VLDVELVEALHGLGLDAGCRAALPLLPATYRAWALGPVSDEDRAMVRELAQHGAGMPEAAARRLDDWLAHPPEAARKDRACTVLVEVYKRMGEPRMDLCEVCRAIARTQSSLLGPLQEPEREALEGLLQSIGVDPWEDFSATGKLLQDHSTDAAMMDWLDDEHTMPGIPASVTGAKHVPPVKGPPGVAMGDGQAEIVRTVETELVVGRSGQCGLQLAHDGQASRKHCVFTRGGPSTVTVRDLGSCNGTLVNGVLVGEAALAGGEEITVGETVLRYRA